MLRGLIAVALLVLAGTAMAQPKPASAPATAPAITVAVFDFDANVNGNPDMGKHVADALTAMLSGQAGLQLVERAQLEKVTAEQALNLTGLVDQDKVVKVGHLVGAKILVTGKIFSLDKNLYVAAKMIGTETTLVQGILVKGKTGADTGELVAQLAEKLQVKLLEEGPKLIAATEGSDDPLAAVKERLAKKVKPVVMIQVAEAHIGQAPRAGDPPVDMELRSMLINCGFTVADPAEITPAKAKAELLLKGEAFSEMAGRVQSLVSCTARVELNVVNVADGKVIAALRATTRAADLSENIAGKNALQAAGHDVGLQLLTKLADTLPDAK